MSSCLVSIFKNESFSYPDKPPFNPPVIYPEFSNYFANYEIDQSNEVYKMVRESLNLLKFDYKNSGTTKWNPLKEIIKEGNTVFIKPNMISEKHKYSDDWDYVITHGSVIRGVLDYVFLALKGHGRVIIGDAPQTDSNFSRIIDLMGLSEIRKVYEKFVNFEISLINLQDENWIVQDGVYLNTVKLPGDPMGKFKFDLGTNSMFSELNGSGKIYYGAFYNIAETNEHHSQGKHEYSISKSPIFADVFINIPKLKTHKKCGITVNLKSLVGINANKNWLPHYVFGSPDDGGDQFPQKGKKKDFENKLVVKIKQLLLSKNKYIQFLAKNFRSLAYKFFGSNKKIVRSGNWFGNDTVWRMALDLNRILLYSDKTGIMNYKSKPKPFLSVVDGIISMEGNGPTSGVKKDTGILLVGTDPVVVDAVSAKVMGFDYRNLSILKNAFNSHMYPLTDVNYNDIVVISNVEAWSKSLKDFRYQDSMKFKPHFGWVGHIEDNEAT